MFAAIRRASSRVSSLAADRRAAVAYRASNSLAAIWSDLQYFVQQKDGMGTTQYLFRRRVLRGHRAFHDFQVATRARRRLGICLLPQRNRPFFNAVLRATLFRYCVF